VIKVSTCGDGDGEVFTLGAELRQRALILVLPTG
jgi:hypothetical protein